MRDATPSDVLSGAARWCCVVGENVPVMASLGEASVGAVITDPPYDERTHAGYETGNRHGEKKNARHVDIDFAPVTPADFVADLLRVSAGWVVAFCALEQIGAYAEAGGRCWVRAGIWHRPRAAPQFTGDRPAQAADGVAILHPRRGRTRWNGGGGHAYWSVGHAHDEMGTERGHPTRKPLALMRTLVRLFSDPDDVVADFFAGSGTTGVAALAEGRRVILVERDPTYAAVAIARCEAAAAGVPYRADPRQGKLFGS